jgi:hypothetical protein
MLKELLRNRALWAIVLVLALGLSLRALKPLYAVQSAENPFWDQHPLRSKLETAASAQRKPEFVLLGSSLAMNANYQADCRSANRAAIFGGEYYCYTNTSFLSRQLSNVLKTSVSGLNLTCPACMVADADSILEELYATGCKPAFVVYCVAPRDFMDNVVGEHMYHSFAVTPNRWLRETLLQSHATERAIDQLFGRLCHTYCVRHDYQVLCALATSSLIDNALANANVRIKNEGTGAKDLSQIFITHRLDTPLSLERLAHHRRDYLQRYQPFSAQQFDNQWRHLASVSQLCKQNGTALYLVNMPISDRNQQLMSPGFEDKYYSRLKSFCAHGDATLIDLPQRVKFASTDFRDTVHLRTSPSVQAFNLIAQQIALNELTTHQAVAAGSSAIAH